MRFVTSPLVVAVALGLIGRVALEEEEDAPSEEHVAGIESSESEADPGELPGDRAP